jgi:hypothetical protein
LIIAFALYCSLLVALSVCKSAELFLPAIYQFEFWLGGDKLMHLKLSLLLSLLACFASNKVNLAGSLNFFWRIATTQAILVAGLLVDEGHQYFATSRRFEWLDFSYGATGLFMGLIVYLAVAAFTHSYCWYRR